MNGLLSRVVRRAWGGAVSPIRPRLASRFAPSAHDDAGTLELLEERESAPERRRDLDRIEVLPTAVELGPTTESAPPAPAQLPATVAAEPTVAPPPGSDASEVLRLRERTGPPLDSQAPAADSGIDLTVSSDRSSAAAPEPPIESAAAPPSEVVRLDVQPYRARGHAPVVTEPRAALAPSPAVAHDDARAAREAPAAHAATSPLAAEAAPLSASPQRLQPTAAPGHADQPALQRDPQPSTAGATPPSDSTSQVRKLIESLATHNRALLERTPEPAPPPTAASPETAGPTIQVRIGRIEVHAPAPQPAATRTTPRLTLDAYLARSPHKGAR